MPLGRNRSQLERERLIFPSVEKASEFAEKVENAWEKKDKQSSEKKKKVVEDLVAQEFEKQGEAVETIAQPWEHTPTEHAEAQALVDIAFAKDLLTAIKEARKSKTYPRNLDLMHDALTDEMYQLVIQHQLNRQPLHMMFFLMLGIGIFCFGFVFFLLLGL